MMWKACLVSMSLALNSNEYLLIYNSSDIQDREAAGYLRTLRSISINEQDVSKDMLTETQLVEAANMLDVDITKLLRTDKKVEDDFTSEEILKLLRNQPELLNTPFVLSRERSFFVDSPLNLIKEQF
tara:strand:+ start:29822 stop:30202 length:381 start_codon:yes stop_codon:yes gene_type:complete